VKGEGDRWIDVKSVKDEDKDEDLMYLEA